MLDLITIAASLAFDHCASPEVVAAGGPSPDDADGFSMASLRDALAMGGADVGLVEELRDALRVELASAAN